MLQEFYELMGWNEDGAVGPARLKELGLASFPGEPVMTDPEMI